MQDTNFQDTALREAQEELFPRKADMFQQNVEILGLTTKLPSASNIMVTPVLGVLWQDLNNPIGHHFPGDQNEVELVFCVSLQELFDKETTHILPKNRFGLEKAPLFPSVHGNIWGLTAFILRPLLHRLFKPVFSLRKM